MAGEGSADATGVRAAFGPGSRLAGYVLEEQVGAGGMAVVFRAVDQRLGRRVALKILAPALAADQAFRQRFIRESISSSERSRSRAMYRVPARSRTRPPEMSRTSVRIPYPCWAPSASAVRIMKVASCIARVAM